MHRKEVYSKEIYFVRLNRLLMKMARYRFQCAKAGKAEERRKNCSFFLGLFAVWHQSPTDGQPTQPAEASSAAAALNVSRSGSCALGPSAKVIE